MMRLPKGRLSAKQKVVMCPHRGSDPIGGYLGPKSCRCGGVPHCRYALPPWMHLANGEGSCPLLCGPGTKQ